LTILGDYHLPFGKAEAQAKAARWLWQSYIIWLRRRTAPGQRCGSLFSKPNARCKMPLLFYLPLIIWRGPLEAEQSETRVAVKVKAWREIRRWQNAIRAWTAARYGLAGLLKPIWRWFAER
jgi:hypothetical protein